MSDHCIFSKLYANKLLCTLSQITYPTECTGSSTEKADCPFWYRPMGTIEPNKIDMRPEDPRVAKRRVKKN